MTDAVGQSLAACVKSLQNKLGDAVAVSSPESEFARFVFESTGSSVPFESPPLPSDTEGLRLGRAPALAAAGYRLASHRDGSLVEAWNVGFQRLQSADPFPHDRLSFAYRPADLIGLSFGAVGVDDETGKDWLRSVVRRRLDEEHLATWPGLMYLVAAEAVELPVPLPSMSGSSFDFDLLQLAFMRWWLDRTGTTEPEFRARQLDEALLTHVVLTEPTDLDLPALAMLLQATEAAVRRRVAWFVDSSESAVDHSASGLGVLVRLLRRFHLSVQQLQRRYGGRGTHSVDDEYDVQDLLHAVLKLHFDDVRPEEWTPSYGGRSSRMDFLLKPERIVVEVKMTRDRLRQKQVTQELTIDREHYRAHPDCETLVCFVYDPGNYCPNPAALETDLSRSKGDFRVSVVVAPVGT